MKVRQVIVLGLGGLLLGGCLACSSKKADVEMPAGTIPLPKEGPVAAPAGPQPGKAAQPVDQGAPAAGKAAY
jgi:hypothetical protein